VLQLEHADDSLPVSELTKIFPAAQLEQLSEADPLYWPVPQLEQAEDSLPVSESRRYFPAAHVEHDVDAEPLY
jgi:hypothetical protein